MKLLFLILTALGLGIAPEPCLAQVKKYRTKASTQIVVVDNKWQRVVPSIDDWEKTDMLLSLHWKEYSDLHMLNFSRIR